MAWVSRRLGLPGCQWSLGTRLDSWPRVPPDGENREISVKRAFPHKDQRSALLEVDDGRYISSFDMSEMMSTFRVNLIKLNLPFTQSIRTILLSVELRLLQC